MPGRARWLLLGYRFGGVRIGVRTTGLPTLHHARIVMEFGAGVF